MLFILHPDKAGPESTAAFQRLRNAFEKIRQHFKLKNESRSDITLPEDDDQKFFDENFEAFNFPFENRGSFTVQIEDYLADTWQECITLVLGEPTVKVNARGTTLDRFWKVEYGQERRIDITVHIYNKPKNKKGSKLMVQGSIQSLICSYVFSELPKIYKKACVAKPKPLLGDIKKKQTAPGKPTVKCDQCHFSSSMIQM